MLNKFCHCNNASVWFWHICFNCSWSLFIIHCHGKYVMLLQYWSRSGSQMIHFAKFINETARQPSKNYSMILLWNFLISYNYLLVSKNLKIGNPSSDNCAFLHKMYFKMFYEPVSIQMRLLNSNRFNKQKVRIILVKMQNFAVIEKSFLAYRTPKIKKLNLGTWNRNI